jgi:hypothetical protein
MKRLITTLSAATLLLGAPIVASADDDRDHGRYGYPSYGPPGKGWKHGHNKHGYRPAPVYVERYFYPPPRVFVPAPVYVPVPVPAPYRYPSRPVNSVDIGFRIFF